MKTLIAGCVLLALFLAGLGALALFTPQAGELLLARSDSGAELSLDALEKLSREELRLTWEVREEASVKILSATHAVQLVGTNEAYADLMGYPVIAGGFFTESAVREGSRHVALGERAAMLLFGSDNIAGHTLELNGHLWLVTGVIRDGEKRRSNLYVPAGFLEERPSAVLALTAGRSVSDVGSRLSQAGAQSLSDEQLNLARLGAAPRERLLFAAGICLVAALLVLLRRCLYWLRADTAALTELLQSAYLSELFRTRPGWLLSRAARAALIPVSAVGILHALPPLLEMFLRWREDRFPLYASGAFESLLRPLLRLQLPGWMLLGACLLTALALSAAFWRRAAGPRRA